MFFFRFNGQTEFFYLTLTNRILLPDFDRLNAIT